jgi:hypothetical protein
MNSIYSLFAPPPCWTSYPLRYEKTNQNMKKIVNEAPGKNWVVGEVFYGILEK